MTQEFKDAIWNQFGAAIDMLVNVISNCDDTYYQSKRSFFYIAFHSTIFLDYYLTFPPSDYTPTLPFTLVNSNDTAFESIGNLKPDRLYTKMELMDSIELSRIKCKKRIECLTALSSNSERFIEGNTEDDMNYSVLEILLYNLRHTQHHVGQLNLLQREHQGKSSKWSFRYGDSI